MTKYHAKKTKLDGYTFDSMAEARRYGELTLMARNGDIMSLTVHPVYLITHQGQKICKYIADFSYLNRDTGSTVVEDVKSPQTRKLPVYRLKKKLVRAFHGIDIKEVEA